MTVDIELVLSVLGGILAWIGYMERRMYAVRTEVKEFMEEKERSFKERGEITKEAQQDIRGQILRLEDKIDELIKLVYTGAK